MTTTPNLGLPIIAGSQAQKHLTHNEALNIIDALIQGSVISLSLPTPPASPNAGDCYIVAASATGEWAGWEDSIAVFLLSGTWKRLTPTTGWRVWVESVSREYKFDAGWTESLIGVTLPIKEGGVVKLAAPLAINFKGGGVVVTDVSGTAEVTISGGGSGGLIHVVEQLTAGTAPGAGAINVEDPRGLTTVLRNTIPGASLLGLTVTLPIGDYEVWGYAPGYRVGRTRASIYSVTDGALILTGSSDYCNTTDGFIIAKVLGTLGLVVETEVRLTHRREATKSTNDMGVATNFGGLETFAEVIFRKV